MAGMWQSVRVFISSTFRDMHAERDHLVKVVFPALREKLELHRVHLIDIDLRWGVTREQAENDQVLGLCLQLIEECRPFFLGILGDRYGWVPTHYPADALTKYGWVQHHTGKSVTELEVLHGVLQNSAMRRHAFFYLRDPDCLRAMPEGLRRSVYSETDPALVEKLIDLKQRIRDSGYPVFQNYPARWDPDAFDRPTKTNGRLVGLEVFGQRVQQQLWDAIRTELILDESPTATVIDPFVEEADHHERFMESRLRVYVGREATQHELHRFADGSHDAPGLVTGPSGSGKSSILARFVTTYRQTHPTTFVLPHFVGASPLSTNLRTMLRRLCLSLTTAFKLPGEVPEETVRLVEFFRDILGKVPADRNVLLVLDALDQLDETDRAHHLEWLPSRLPPHVKLLVSCIRDTGKAEPVQEAFRHRPHQLVEVRPLDDAERREIIRHVPALSAKTLDSQQIDLLLTNPATANPLFLLVALEELRGFGSYEQLTARIADFPKEGDTVTRIFTQVIERLEDEYDKKLVRSALAGLSSARRGLSERELRELVASLPTAEALPSLLRQLRPYLQSRAGLIDFYHRNLLKAVGDQYLASATERREAHARLARYFDNQNWRHGTGGANVRKADELPWQRLQACRESSTGGLAETLTVDCSHIEDLFADLRLVEAKCTAGMTYDLVADYRAALEVLPDSQSEQLRKRERAEQLGAYARSLLEYARASHERRAQPDSPQVAPPAPPMTGETRASIRGTDRAEPGDPSPGEHPGRSRVLAYSVFVSSFAADLHAYPQETIPFARNHAATGLVALQGETLATRLGRVWLRTDPRPSAPPAWPACLATLRGHTSGVNSVAITPGATKIVSASEDSTVRVWDRETGEQRAVLRVHWGGVRGVSLSADGKTAVSRGEDHTLRIWDLASGQERKVIRIVGESNGTKAVAITPDARRAVSGGGYGDITLRLWDLEGGVELYRVPVPSEVGSVAITADGSQAVTASRDGKLHLWDLDSAKAIGVLTGHTDWVNEVRVTPDGRTAVSGGDGTVRVWDLVALKVRHVLSGDTARVNTVAITPDGGAVLAATSDGRILVWDGDTGERLRVLQGHLAWISCIVVVADGSLAITASGDHTLRVWDLVQGQQLPSQLGQGRKDDAVWSMPTPDGTGTVTESQDRSLVVSRPEGRISSFGHAVWAKSVAIARDGPVAITSHADRTLGVWDLNTTQRVATLQGHTSRVNCVVVSLDGKTAVSAGHEGVVCVWDVPSRALRHAMQGHTDSVNLVALTNDGDHVVSAGADKRLRVWDAHRGTEVCALDISGASFVLSPCGTRVVAPGRDTEWSAWDVASGRPLCHPTLHPLIEDGIIYTEMFRMGAVALTPDGARAILASDQRLFVVDLATGQVLHMFADSNNPTNDLILALDGRQLLVVRANALEVEVWDLERQVQVTALRGHTGRVRSVSLSADGRFALSAAEEDRMLRCWDLGTGKECAVLSSLVPITHVVGLNSGGQSAIVSNDGQVRFLSLEAG